MSNLQDAFDKAQDCFDQEAALGFSATYQFSILDSGDYYLVIADGGFSIHEGLVESSDTTLSMDAETIRAVLTGSLGGMQALMFGRLQVDGNMLLASKLLEFFAFTLNQEND